MKLYKTLIIFLLIIQPNLLCALQGNRFEFTQIQYNGDWNPYPESWQDILEFLTVTTSIKSSSKRKIIKLSDDELYHSPFIVILGVDKPFVISEIERERLRKYISNGGLIFVENSSGIKNNKFGESFRKELSKILPEKVLKKLLPSHPIYKSFYLLRGVGGRRLVNNYIEGIDIDGRTVVLYSENDIFGSWAKDRFGNYLWECVPGGEKQRFEAHKLTLNILMYSVTGTYKSDAIHKPYIQRKLKRR